MYAKTLTPEEFVKKGSLEKLINAYTNVFPIARNAVLPPAQNAKIDMTWILIKTYVENNEQMANMPLMINKAAFLVMRDVKYALVRATRSVPLAEIPTLSGFHRFAKISALLSYKKTLVLIHDRLYLIKIRLQIQV
jgi:hypothetical protein